MYTSIKILVKDYATVEKLALKDGCYKMAILSKAIKSYAKKRNIHNKADYEHTKN